MKFSTEVEIKSNTKRIEIHDKIFSIGSCFATEMHDLLSNAQWQTLNNPFGTLFNPWSINQELTILQKNKKYTEEDLIAYQDEYISLDHHTSFNSRNIDLTLDKINHKIELGNAFLRDCRFVIITYGTSFIYEFLPKQKLVANCHKIPGKFFKKRLLTPEEIETSISETIKSIKSICKFDVQILFSISPVRHSKDGFVENNRSKSLLISAIHEAIEKNENCHYLPIYEIMMDELRDYRFYKEDLLHPSKQAVNYIFEKFSKAYFSDRAQEFMAENFKITQALQHRPSDDNHPKYQEFLRNLKQKISEQQTKASHKIFVEHLTMNHSDR
ncbi:GSCFA domain-containing protein [Amniculibacterium aquaticum]|uniref:GSCFA domain-containing protein n=1 Tax=Amniculibacterium aquaticum TaxID=2479858 RepID=UPI000F5A56A2|nr:GSCFA domain-containing protein [Amniculibacterium aquaticum]